MKEMRSALLRDIGMAILLLWAFFQALMMMWVSVENRLTYVVMLILMDAVILAGFSGRISICAVFASTLTCTWVSYKLYGFYVNGSLIELTDYLMIPLPLLGAGACALFQKGLRGIDSENTMLRRQVEELVMVDDVTGLYNQRALFHDLRGIISYAARNGLPISLMIVQPRYESELRSMLSTRQYLEMRQLMSQIVANAIRVEDKVYSIDEKCTLAIVLTTDEPGAELVRNRLKDTIQSKDAFPGILSGGTKMDVRFACKEYDKERFGENMIAYKAAVESELVYDV